MTSKGTRLIEQLKENPIDFAEHLDLLNEFFRGFDITELIPLIQRSNSRIRGCGVWIASELGEGLGMSAHPILEALSNAVVDNHPRIRFDALSAIFLSANGPMASYFRFVVLSLSDSNLFIREQLITFIAKATDDQLMGAMVSLQERHQDETAHIDGIRLLLHTAPTDGQLNEFKNSDDPLKQAYTQIRQLRSQLFK